MTVSTFMLAAVGEEGEYEYDGDNGGKGDGYFSFHGSSGAKCRLDNIMTNSLSTKCLTKIASGGYPHLHVQRNEEAAVRDNFLLMRRGPAGPGCRCLPRIQKAFQDG